ncbi:MAG: metalloregulator ArsR/SmtB family transcription factor [Thermomicrobiales bacterium]|nr:metalloregulator ArsR/SmtB family transcription factor [Thermomicrobiales bacterium]
MTSAGRPDQCSSTPVIPMPLARDAEAVLVARFKALADPTRFAIFRLVAAQQEPICACDVVARFDLSQPTISHHMKILHDAGLITVERRGVWAYYAVVPEAVEFVTHMLGSLVPAQLGATA